MRLSSTQNSSTVSVKTRGLRSTSPLLLAPNVMVSHDAIRKRLKEAKGDWTNRDAMIFFGFI